MTLHITFHSESAKAVTPPKSSTTSIFDDDDFIPQPKKQQSPQKDPKSLLDRVKSIFDEI
jgi:hypothetical protein